MKELVEYIARSIVSAPNDVKVTEETDSGGVVIKLEVNVEDKGRVIGKQGSMVNLIKQETNCNIVVGQNGIVWIKGDNVESELLAKEAIAFITEKSYVGGLTEMVKAFLETKKSKGGF